MGGMKGRCSMKCLREIEVERSNGRNEEKVFDEILREDEGIFIGEMEMGWC